MENKFFQGKKFYLDRKSGYWISTTFPKIRLHVYVWEYYNGKVPKGFHIHHLDGDKSNNSIENLKLIPEFDHLSLHMQSQDRIEFSKRLVERIRPLTKKWHASEEGRKWHSEHGKYCWKVRKELIRNCKTCSNEFVTKTFHQEFCSNKCKSAYRRKTGIDNVEVECANCGRKFYTNKYSKATCCSKSCGRKVYWSEIKKKKLCG